jgi:hypothetical protein
MPAVLPRYTQAPTDQLDYPVDWLGALTLTGETIASADFTAPGLTVIAQQNSTTGATVWLTGGSAGTTYPVTCQIVTNQGRTYDRSFLLYIANPVLPTVAQAPDDMRDWPLDWSRVLVAGEAISSVTWSVPSGLTGGTESSTASTGTIRLSGGTLGTSYPVLCQIVTTQGRTYNGGLSVRIVQL